MPVSRQNKQSRFLTTASWPRAGIYEDDDWLKHCHANDDCDATKSQDIGNEAFISISSVDDREDPTTRYSLRTKGSTISDTYWHWRLQYGQKTSQDMKRPTWSWGTAPTELEAGKTEQSWKEMPSHLTPFVPYVEKPVDEIPQRETRLESNDMDVGTIQKWLLGCSELHGQRCCDPGNPGDNVHAASAATVHPLYLIDVKNYCLVPASAHMRYIALSYVWGGSDVAAASTSSNLPNLLKPKSLQHGELNIPRTVLDVMQLIQKIGERYLWIDRFCIIQDDLETKQNQLSAMGEIYAGAWFTLIAAQTEDASSSLYGDRKMVDSTCSTATEQIETNRRPGITNREIMLEQSVRLMRSTWFSRGWTFQEYHFSKRRVIFHNDTVNWECLCVSWHEDHDIDYLLRNKRSQTDESRSPIATLQAPHVGFAVSPWPDLHRFVRLASLFNERVLTFPEDVLDAFAGCLNNLSKVFPGGFVSGLPAICFDAALLWQPWLPEARRYSKRFSEPEAVLPSWSWAGWAGVMHTESWRSASNYQLMEYESHIRNQQCSWKTFSTVTWSCSEDLTSERRHITLAPECAQPSFDIAEADLPAGWTCKKDSSNECQNLFYHDSDPSRPFRYPIPICDPQGPQQPVINARFLHCTTNRAYLRLGEVVPSWCSNCPAVDIITDSGTWAGVLRLNCLPSEAEPMLSEELQNNKGRCELIEISAGSVESLEIEERSFDEWNRPGCPLSKEVYEFVNVLWIERDDQVAYREALGRVERNIWNGLAKDRIDVTLG